jgi:hypothetical protein
MPLCVRARSGVYAKTNCWFFYRDEPDDLYVVTDGGQTVKMASLLRVLGDPDPLVSGLRLSDLLQNFVIRFGRVHVP